MKDRRARLRPRDGARELYYGEAGSTTVNGNRNLFDDRLPWQSSKPLAELSPNSPQFTQNSPSETGNSVENGNILFPLAKTDGFVFPYSPIIGYNQSVNYNSYDPVHSNQEILAYTRTNAPQINCSGEFTVQNASEAQYALACVHFLRTILKMDFGLNSPTAGTPPPVLLFSAYGEYMFNEIPVLVQGFDIQLDGSVDYIQVPNSTTYVPSEFNISVSMTVQNPPQQLRRFNSAEFRNGKLVKQGNWI